VEDRLKRQGRGGRGERGNGSEWEKAS